MPKYKYMELVKNDLKNRGNFIEFKDTLEYSFNNRYIETWRGMFMFDNSNPKPSDKMIGNFYLECDNSDFDKNVEIISCGVEYLKNKYDLNEELISLFITNRSIWVEIPYKVFGIYPQKNLNKIYKSMATEINEYIKETLKISKALDLTIYKWNGLIHSLGSYLPKVKRWVKKIEYFYLNNDSIFHTREDYYNTLDYLLNSKYDLGLDYSDLNIIEKCQEWVKSIYFNLKNKKEEIPSLIDNKNISFDYNEIINILKNVNFEVGIRNNYLFTYALVLYNKTGNRENSINEVVSFIKEKNINYYNYNKLEIHRSLNSATSGKYNFSIEKFNDIFGTSIYNKSSKNTFIIPREFIKLLNKNKCHWKCYKLLLDILYTKQILNKDYIYNLEGEKYKKNVQAYFEKLQEIGLISYAKNNNEISIKLIEKSKEVYKSYVIIPRCFIENKKINKIKKEIKILFELLHSNIILNKIHFTNIKLETICKNLKSTMDTILKGIEILKKYKIIIGKNIIFFDSKLFKHLVKERYNKVKYQVKEMKEQIEREESKDKKEVRKIRTDIYEIIANIKKTTPRGYVLNDI